MTKTFTYCDLCEKEIIERGWEESPGAVLIQTYCTSQNPMGRFGGGFQSNTFKRECVCQECQRKLSQGIANLLASLSPQLDSAPAYPPHQPQ